MTFFYQGRLKLNEAVKFFGVSMRGMAETDLPFIRRLFVRSRWDELAPSGMSAGEICKFLHQQCMAQHMHYQSHFKKTDYAILIGPEGEAMGRLYLDWMAGDLRIIDISLMPKWQKRGLGKALLECIFEDAAAKGANVTIHVEKNNPALRLYDRLEFHAVEDKEVYWFMEWSPFQDNRRPDIRKLA